MPKRTPEQPPLMCESLKNEAELQRFVTRIAINHGWRVHHTARAQLRKGRWLTPVRGHVGFPDLVLVRPPQLLIVELKSASGRVKPEQQLWIDLMRACGVDARIWRPTDIIEILQTLCNKPAAPP